jgi:hypothetical protein
MLPPPQPEGDEGPIEKDKAASMIYFKHLFITIITASHTLPCSGCPESRYKQTVSKVEICMKLLQHFNMLFQNHDIDGSC